MKYMCKNFQVSTYIYGIHGNQFQYTVYNLENDKVRTGIGYRSRSQARELGIEARNEWIKQLNNQEQGK